ncbi:ketopantoate reductase C-terminal domain-containing protein [Streptomyces sp. WMMC940]|uniref:ketopantoate reductase C-terminal domain-containing protein n=1 Tax=Streptomyces sp. WMMC940 TaxID=3015153 RepID=UPI0022B698BF|nr:ketopantoate reductase C-terminal domain-containing protein [Streptomyces sp. WMMC940]MCZ7461659.1 hypothetical protein [Streptomyces sp. WMMC940]
MERLRAVLDAAGATAVVPGDIRRQPWAEFLFVVPRGGLGAVKDATIGGFRSRPGTRRLPAGAVTEIHRIARAHGIALPAGTVPSTPAFVDR